MAEIKIENVTKKFGDFVAVNNVNLTIHDQEFVVLLGPSGCGKTTLLRTVAGLGMADDGSISIGGRDITYLPPRERNISMVFQSYAIFPHMTVFDNIAFGLKMKKINPEEIKERVHQVAEMMYIEKLLDRLPSKLSGGQRQRVAVSRALVMDAEVLLMDEPLSNLDALLRLEMRAELKKLLNDIRVTTIYVTHDQIEALSMGDRIAVMKDGVIQQIDEPSVVYDMPSNHFVGGFIGNPPMNFLTGQVQRESECVRVQIGEFSVEPTAAMQGLLKLYDGRAVLMGIRAENMELLNTPADNAVRVKVLVVEPLGAQNLLTVNIGNDKVKVLTHPAFIVAPDDDLWLRFPADNIRWVDRDSGKVLYS